jgi:hypothetical protein
MLIPRSLTVFLVLAACCYGSSTLAGPKPSFDCAKAASTAEKRICKNAALAASDASIAVEYRRLQAELDPKAVAALAEDQRWFVGARDEIADAPANMAPPDLGADLKDRVRFLRAINPHPASDFIGSWHNLAGGLDITATPDGKVKVTGNAARPVNGNWVCDFEGIGKVEGGALEVRDDTVDSQDPATGLRLTREGAALKVEFLPAPGSQDRTSPYCGMNGSLDGFYFSVPVGYD